MVTPALCGSHATANLQILMSGCYAARVPLAERFLTPASGVGATPETGTTHG